MGCVCDDAIGYPDAGLQKPPYITTRLRIAMSAEQLDDVDRRLIALLQADARSSATALAEQLDVSDNTVHNRLRRLTDTGVINGYSVSLDYDELGLPFHCLFTCTVRVGDRPQKVEELRALPVVAEVIELMTGQENILVKVVARTDSDITTIAQEIEQLGLEIIDETLIAREAPNPINYLAIEDWLENQR